MRIPKSKLSQEITEAKRLVPGLEVTFVSDDPAGANLRYQTRVDGMEVGDSLSARDLSFHLNLLARVVSGGATLMPRMNHGSWCVVEVADGIVHGTYGVPCTVVDHDVMRDEENDRNLIRNNIIDLAAILGVPPGKINKMDITELIAHRDALLDAIKALHGAE